MKTLQKIHDKIKRVLGLTEEEIEEFDHSSVSIATEIAMYAHYGQYRENGEVYFTHPLNCKKLYQKFVGIVPDDYYCIDRDLMYEYDIPYDGVQEVCMLHDVLEDTEVTMDEIAEVYTGLGLKTYFELYIKRPLELITHDKSMPYDEYISIVLQNPIAAIVKMMDMTDNCNLLGLAGIDDDKISRTKKYIDYIKVINDKYRFIEKNMLYQYAFRKSKSEQNG